MEQAPGRNLAADWELWPLYDGMPGPSAFSHNEADSLWRADGWLHVVCAGTLSSQDGHLQVNDSVCPPQSPFSDLVKVTSTARIP